jgi:murein L,D-transpeptidase YcbB/YkuD
VWPLRPRQGNSALLLILLVLLPGPLAGQLGPLGEQLRQRIEQLREGPSPTIGGTRLVAVQFIPEFYERRGFRLAWMEQRNVDDLIGLIKGAYQHGLDPRDYNLAAIEELVRGRAIGRMPDPARRVDLDLVLTDSLVRLAYHARFGKVNPSELDADWNFAPNLDGEDPVDTLTQALCSGSLRSFLANEMRAPYLYRRLKDALARYRSLAAAGGWPRVQTGPMLQAGDRGERVAVLRRRLRVTGDLAEGERSDPQLFDSGLEAAVRTFQQRHGLEVDGKVGPNTLRALNTTVEQRIGQIRVNLERIRWVYQDLPDDFVLVDIAGFQVHLVRGGQPVWSAKAQVGRPFRETPVFRATMKYLVFHPSWTVPPTILRKDIIPKLKHDPGYLQSKQMLLLDATGEPVDPHAVDWSALPRGSFPYTVRQRPGPENPLGRVKFMFPNPHFVYLHDTPSQSLFGHAQRSFSSGCIRIEHPLELARLLLADPGRWDEKAIRELSEEGVTRSVVLEHPLPVLLLYWTAEVADDGRVHFREDIYGRDQRVLEALDAPPRFTGASGLADWNLDV